MKVNKRIIVAMLLIFAMLIVGMATKSFAAIGDGVTATVTSNPANGAEVKVGDIITYTITIKNDSDRGYWMPTLMTQIPASTEFVSITTNDMIEDGATVEDGVVTCMGTALVAHSEQVYTLKVKVTQDATGEINYAHITEEEEDGTGAVLFLLFNSADPMEIQDVLDILDSEEFENAATRAEAQALLGEKAYMDIVTQKQFHTIAKTEEQPVTPTPEKPVEETAQPVVKEEKPTVLPKTGMDINYVAISIAVLMIVAGTVIIAKKEK